MSLVDKLLTLTFILLLAMWVLVRSKDTVAVAGGLADTYVKGVGALTPR